MKKLASRIGRATVLGTVLASMGLGLTTTPAAAAPMTARISIAKARGNLYRMPVDVVIVMPRAQAQAYKNVGHKIVLTLWGDDPTSDDRRRAPEAFEGYDVTSNGMELHTELYLSKKECNEDSGWYEGEGDELYMGVRHVNPQGTTLRSVESNRVYGKF